jgi:hypothetical protein
MAAPDTPPDTVDRLRKLGIYDNAWKGEPAFVMGGGPSIREHGLAISQLQGRGRIIVVNRSVELPLEPDIWMWMDAQYYHKCREGKLGPYAKLRYERFDGIRISRVHNSMPGDVYQVGWAQGPGISESIFKAHIGNNSGFWGVSWAYCLGANPIVLFGYDYAPSKAGSQCWWHDGHGRKSVPASPYDRMREMLDNAAQDFTKNGRVIWNCSPETKLTRYPVIGTLEEMFTKLAEFDASVSEAVA